MAQPLQSINLVAPAFKGVNTEDSPIAQDPSFADVADNAVIDKRGRIAARKGVDLLTNDAASITSLGNDYISKIHYFYNDDGDEEVFSAANNTLFTGTTALTAATITVNTGASEPAYSITDNNWKIVNFNNKAYFFQRNHQPLVYSVSGGTGTLETFWNATGTSTPSYLYCHEALAAYGRLWIADSSASSQIIYWSDLLIGEDFTGGSSGSIDISKAWPDGFDEIRALAAHNNHLIIFGKHSILVYGGASSPATMALVDTVAGVGCICRNSIQYTGTDVLFVSETGLKSFGRTIQEKSMPLSDLSISVKTEFIAEIIGRSEPTASVYSPENSFYLITFPNSTTTYCFDLKGRLENGGFRVTRWGSAPFRAYERKADGTLLVGTVHGIGEYANYYDQYWDSTAGEIANGIYRFRYYSPALTFGDPSKIKILKKLRPTLVGANNATVSMRWSYDFDTSFKSQQFTVGDQTPFYFSDPRDASNNPAGGGLAEFSNPVDGLGNPAGGGDAEFTGGVNTSRKAINTTGGGSVITIGLEADIEGDALSLQEINVLALIGKTI